MNKLQLEDEEYHDYMAQNDVIIPEREVYKGIYYYTCPLFLLIGTIGNITAAIVLQRMISRVLSTCAYVLVVVICDLLVLYIRAGNVWYYYLTGQDIQETAMHSSNALCKLYPFVDGVLLYMAIWAMVAMATETAIACLRPYLINRIYSLKRATAVILLIIVLLVCLNAHCFWSYALVKEDQKEGSEETYMCTNAKQGHHDSEEFRRVTWPVLDMVLSDLIPILTIFSCVVMIFTKLSRNRREASSNTDPWNNYPFDVEGAKDLRCTFAKTLLIFVLFLLTKFGHDIFRFLVESIGTMQTYPYTFEAKRKLTKCICDVILFIVLSCKCLLFLAVSKRFRLEFKRLLRCFRWSDTDTPVNHPSRHTKEKYRYRNVNGVHTEPPPYTSYRKYTTTTV